MKDRVSPDGKQFEADVRELLRLAGYRVTQEALVGHKKIDSLAEDVRLGARRRIAVECKDHQSPLSKSEIGSLLADYLALYESNEIDEILIVTRSGLTPSAEQHTRRWRAVRHLSFLELQNSIIDFSSYLQNLVAQASEDGLADYYIPGKGVDIGSLDQFLELWLRDGAQPLAVLGGYGAGKTSFVRMTAATLATAALRDSRARIPVVVRLADISAEQSLEGLLGRTLATTALVRNYSFDAFMALNTMGRLVIFLDGFDEMKHTLRWDQFRYNLRQLNRLVVGDCRVVLLGRPTAFLSDAEQLQALHGLRYVGNATLQEHDWPDYLEIVVEPFGSEEIFKFLTKYVNHLQRRATEWRVDADQLLGTLKSNTNLWDLATRPVQLRILAEVLPQWNADHSQLNPGRLYSLFIDLVTERKLEKVSRQRFSLTERRKFARDLGYWLWTSRSRMNVELADIPEAFFGVPLAGETLDGLRRDMISACFLDRKLGDVLSFPHRSFQEYLVAEHIRLSVGASDLDLTEASRVSTPEVCQFISDTVDRQDLRRLINRLRSVRGVLSSAFLLSWLRAEGSFDMLKQDVERSGMSGWLAYLLVLHSTNEGGVATRDRVFEQIRVSIAHLKTSADDALAMMAAATLLARFIARTDPLHAGKLLWNAVRQVHSRSATSPTASGERGYLWKVEISVPPAPGTATLAVGAATSFLSKELIGYAALDEMASTAEHGPWYLGSLPLELVGDERLKERYCGPAATFLQGVGAESG